MNEKLQSHCWEFLNLAIVLGSFYMCLRTKTKALFRMCRKRVLLNVVDLKDWKTALPARVLFLLLFLQLGRHSLNLADGSSVYILRRHRGAKNGSEKYPDFCEFADRVEEGIADPLRPLMRASSSFVKLKTFEISGRRVGSSVSKYRTTMEINTICLFLREISRFVGELVPFGFISRPISEK